MIGELLLVGTFYISWSFAVLPIWVLLVSTYVQTDNLRGRQSGR
jgi:hypothetical protein